MINIEESLKIIKKLKVYEKILKRQYVAIKKSLGDEDIITEINDELRQFLAAKINNLLGKSTTIVIKNDTPLPLVVSPGEPVPTSEEGFSMTNPIVSDLMKKHGFDPTLPAENRVAIMKAVKEEFMAIKKATPPPAPVGGPVVASTGVNITEHSRALSNLFGK